MRPNPSGLDPPRPRLLARYGRKGVDQSRRFHVGGEAQFFGVRPASLIDGLQYRFFLIRLSNSRGFWNFDKFSRLHVVDVAVNWNVIGDQGMVTNARDILDDTPGVV